MTNFRYVPIPPTRIEEKKPLGPASYLLDLLTDHQTDAAGHVNYGKAISYAWIRSRWANAPCVRTLKRHMSRLKRLGHVQVRVLGFGCGMIVRIVGSVKWSPVPQTAEQLALFAPGVVSISSGKPVGNPVEKLLVSTVSNFHMGTIVSPVGGQKCPRKEVKNLREEKTYGNTSGETRSSPVEDEKAIRLRREFLQRQVRTLQLRYNVKTSC